VDYRQNTIRTRLLYNSQVFHKKKNSRISTLKNSRILALFSVPRYIDRRTVTALKSTYEKYYTLLQNDLILQYVKTNSIALQIDDIGLNRFITKMQRLESDLEKHNNSYVDAKLTELKTYFDHIMDDIDPDIKLDDEQRRAVIIDDNHCLLVAGAGAGKTTTMAAKVKYLVEKQGIRPQDIIVISYTNKAVNELKERINTRLKILAKIAFFRQVRFRNNLAALLTNACLKQVFRDLCILRFGNLLDYSF